MTKQEEIEQGFCDRLQTILNMHDNGLTIKRETAQLFLGWLASQDVVIQVIPPYNNRSLSREEIDYLARGGKILEPLIEGKTIEGALKGAGLGKIRSSG